MIFLNFVEGKGGERKKNKRVYFAGDVVDQNRNDEEKNATSR